MPDPHPDFRHIRLDTSTKGYSSRQAGRRGPRQAEQPGGSGGGSLAQVEVSIVCHVRKLFQIHFQPVGVPAAEPSQ